MTRWSRTNEHEYNSGLEGCVLSRTSTSWARNYIHANKLNVRKHEYKQVKKYN